MRSCTVSNSVPMPTNSVPIMNDSMVYMKRRIQNTPDTEARVSETAGARALAAQARTRVAHVVHPVPARQNQELREHAGLVDAAQRNAFKREQRLQYHVHPQPRTPWWQTPRWGWQ